MTVKMNFVCYCYALFLTFRLKHGFIIENIYDSNVHDNQNEDLSVDLSIEDEDYEMFNNQDTDNPDKVKNVEQKKIQELNSMMRMNKGEKEVISSPYCKKPQWVKRNPEVRPTDAKIDKAVSTEPVSMSTIHSTGRKKVIDVLPKAYYAVKSGKFESESTFVDSMREVFSFDLYSNCTAEDTNGIGLRAIKCLITEYTEHRLCHKTLAIRLWNIAAIWLCVYLVVALPLWCTKGWCCFCLCCKFFKPQDTIKEAKKYLVLNPPGTLITKKGGVIHYEPTEREKDCYEEFGHFIRTL